jgi:ABC-type polysaccharide/polyol phosphate export permease
VLATGRFHVMSLVFVPVMILVQLAMLYPMALVLASANVLVRDVEYLVGITLQLLFFLTPIVYAANAIPAAYVWAFDLNPFSWMITAWRSVLYEGRLDAVQVGHCLAAAAIACLIAIPVQRIVSPRIAEVL